MVWSVFGTGKYNFGYIPDPPEPDDTECMEDCDSCVWHSIRKDGVHECNDVYGEGYKEKSDDT